MPMVAGFNIAVSLSTGMLVVVVVVDDDDDDDDVTVIVFLCRVCAPG